MKTTIKIDMVGQTAVCYIPTTSIEEMERSAKIFTVTAVGRKYIKAGGRDFEKDSLLCKQPFCKLFIGTPQEFSQAIRLMFSIRKQMERLNLQQLEKLQEIVSEMTDNIMME